MPQARIGYARPLRQDSVIGGKYCLYAMKAQSVPSIEPVITSKGWWRASMIRDTATRVAARMGVMQRRVFQASPRLSIIWSLPPSQRAM